MDLAPPTKERPTSSVENVIGRIIDGLLPREPKTLVHVRGDGHMKRSVRRVNVILQKPCQHDPHLVAPHVLPVAIEALQVVVDGEAGVGGRDGLQKGIEGRADDDVRLGRVEADVV